MTCTKYCAMVWLQCWVWGCGCGCRCGWALCELGRERGVMGLSSSVLFSGVVLRMNARVLITR
jgi:hypothetical protein